MIKCILIPILFLATTIIAYGQSVTNVRAHQEDKKIVITYDLSGGAAGQSFIVTLLVSEDGGYTWEGTLTAVTGDAGSGVKASSSKQLTWNVLSEPGRDKLQGDRIAFKIRAEFTTPVSGSEPEMVFVQGGTFQMGSNEGENDEKPVHSVTVGSFYMGKYEVTVAQFRQFINETGYQTDADKDGGSYIWTGSEWEKHNLVNWNCDAEGHIYLQNEYNHPVIHVSWNDATEYCRWLSRKTSKSYRLPTDAEWEYAARGGNQSRGYMYSGSNTLGDVAWFFDNSDSKTHPVGKKQSNELGIYDMSGNVWEWCSDWYGSDYYSSSPSNNPKGPVEGSYRVLRGGSWYTDPQYCRTANRSYGTPDYRNSNLGFRLFLVP